MKIAIGAKLKTSAWGGGNQFISSLVIELRRRGDIVTFDLKDNDIDIILLVDPRSYVEGITFGSLEIIYYLLFINNKSIVIHRINECDERKKSRFMNKFLKWSNYCADYTVFISSWLRTLDIYQKDTNSCIIMNGADEAIFNTSKNKNIIWDKKSPLKLVTHHWSPNLMKGWDVYKRLDDLISHTKWNKLIDFTYIGRLPEGFKFKKTKYIKPLSGDKLSDELSKHHVYITASINEPAGMHHIEGISCGLPVIYRNSGGIPEYCDNYGISFEGEDFYLAIEKMLSNYDNYKEKTKNYPHNAKKMTMNYLNLFDKLLRRKDKIVKERNLFRNPFNLSKNLIFLLPLLKKLKYIFF